MLPAGVLLNHYLIKPDRIHLPRNEIVAEDLIGGLLFEKGMTEEAVGIIKNKLLRRRSVK